MQIAPLQHHKRPRNSAIDAVGNADGIHCSAIDFGAQGITVADVGAGLGAPGWGDHKCQQQHQVKDDTHGPVLVYDGGCPFCSHFAELSELRGGIAGLIIRDGRADHALRQSLAQRGCHLRDGAVVIDVGINRVDDASAKRGYRLVGDVDYDAVAPKCQAITPVPGGVGPMTIAMLMANTVKACRQQSA